MAHSKRLSLTLPVLSRRKASIDVYISPSGNDTSGDGSKGNPYATLAKAVTAAVAGQTIGCLDGIYRERNVTIDKAITITAASGSPIFAGSTNYSSWSKTSGLSMVYETSYTPSACHAVWNGPTRLAPVADPITCDATPNSCYFDNPNNKLYVNLGGPAPSSIEAATSGTYFFLLSAAHITISKIIFQWAIMAHYLYNAASSSTWSRCTFRYWSPYSSAKDYGFILFESSGNLLANCTFTGEAYATSSANLYAISMTTNAGSVNLIGCSFTNGKYGVYCEGGTLNASSCSFNSFTDGIYCLGSAATTSTLYACLFVNCRHASVRANGSITMTVKRCLATLDANTAYSSAGYFYIVDPGATCTFYHCIAADGNLDLSNPRTGFYFKSNATLTVKNCISYNNLVGYHLETGYSPTLVFDYNDCHANTSAYTNITPGAHCLTSDPTFASDYSLQTGSPCIDAGVEIAGVNEDHLGSAPDIGCYEVA